MTFFPTEFWVTCSAACCLGGGLAWLAARSLWRSNVARIERELRQTSEAVCQVAEIQLKIYEKFCGSLTNLEEKILELSVPGGESALPLERRHHVLALARKGATLDEIIRKLSIPRGEAELILRLRKYAGGRPAMAKSGGEVGKYAQG